MKTISVSNVRKNLYKLLDETLDTNEPLQITTRRGDLVLISSDDWEALQETLYLVSVPGMKEKLIGGRNTPIEECKTPEELGWDLD
ncbi:hypothetical protein JCM15765_12170 [Paradesulfitobacterium aromaticivorans]